MTVIEFEAWLSGAVDGAYRSTTTEELSERNQLQALRELDRRRREVQRLKMIREIEESETANISAPTNLETWSSYESRITDAESRIAEVVAYLRSAGWPLEDWQTNAHS